MEKGLAITIAITVPIALVVLVALVVCLIRRFMDKSRMGSVMYDRISHELDDEELEFKRSIEMRNNDGSAYEKVEYSDENSDEDDELYGFGLDDETGFGAKDMERLNMLDKFRSNLVAGAGAVLKKGGSTDDLMGSNHDDTDIDEAERGDAGVNDYEESKDVATTGNPDGTMNENNDVGEHISMETSGHSDTDGSSGLPGLRI